MLILSRLLCAQVVLLDTIRALLLLPATPVLRDRRPLWMHRLALPVPPVGPPFLGPPVLLALLVSTRCKETPCVLPVCPATSPLALRRPRVQFVMRVITVGTKERLSVPPVPLALVRFKALALAWVAPTVVVVAAPDVTTAEPIKLP